SLIATFGAYSAPLSAKSITDFGLYDQAGEFYQLSRIEADLILLIAFQIGDPKSRSAVAEALSLRQEFQSSSLFIAALTPDPAASRNSVQSELVFIGETLPVLLDPSQVVSSSLAVERYGEVLLIDSRRLNLLYRGSVGDAGTINGEPTLLQAAIEA